MDQKIADLLPDGQSGTEGIQCKHTDKEDGEDAKDPGYPVQNFT